MDERATCFHYRALKERKSYSRIEASPKEDKFELKNQRILRFKFCLKNGVLYIVKNVSKWVKNNLGITIFYTTTYTNFEISYRHLFFTLATEKVIIFKGIPVENVEKCEHIFLGSQCLLWWQCI